MLYFNGTDGTFYVNTKADSGLSVSIEFTQEGDDTTTLTINSDIVDGGYYQTATFDASELVANLTPSVSYEVRIYSGGLLVYTDKMYYGEASEELNEGRYIETSENNDFIILQ